jgi:DNA-binding MarR family transcriptional regulator
MLSVKDVTARVDMDKSRVSRAATRLTGAGLLSKVADKGDGRLVALTLTDQGRALMARLIPLALAYEAEVLGMLGVERDAFARGLAVLGGAGEERQSAPDAGAVR